MIDFKALSAPFPPEEVSWRLGSTSKEKMRGMALAFVDARTVMDRLDDVCGPAGWQCRYSHANGKTVCDIGILCDGEWIWKADGAGDTDIEQEKGALSDAFKRAAVRWGIGRYLYMLDESFAEVSEDGTGRGWNYATLPDKQGGGSFYWKAPKLPSWALPKEPEYEISEAELKALKKAWKDKFAPNSRNPSELSDGFIRFVHSVCGEFPVTDISAWLRVSYETCMTRIKETTDPKGPSSDVRFDS